MAWVGWGTCVEIQPNVRAYAESLGAFGQSWLASLPSALERQCLEWSLLIGETLPGGSRSFVCRVTKADGERAVLKLALPEPSLESQIATLVAARGRGYVNLLAYDLERGAVLLESLGLPINELVDSVPEVLRITAATLHQAWQVQLEPPVPALEEHKAAGLHALVQGFSSRIPPNLAAVIAQALRYAGARLEARDAARQVLVHGDPHAGNLLRVERERPGAESGYVFVDPEGFRCEPEYDLGVALRDWGAELRDCPDPRAELRRWCESMAQATHTDAEAIWQWAYLERVSTGLYLGHHGLPHLGQPFLAMADKLLE